MLRLFGGVLVMLGIGALGFAKIAQMNKEVKILRGLVGALEEMEGEITFQLTPMPVVFWGLSQRMEEPLKSFFRRLSEGMEYLEEQALSTLWREEVATLSLNQKARGILSELGEVLGRYDGEQQSRAIARTRESLSAILQHQEGEWAEKRKLYATLALTVGALVVILLI